MGFKVVIPARYASTRLPGKPLLDIAGKPMIQHVYERALESGADEVVIATDDKRIVERVEQFGAMVCMTDEAHRSGTDRIAEVARIKNWGADEIVVNLQGDEPDMPPELVAQVAEDMIAHRDASVTTLATAVTDRQSLFDSNVVKVVMDEAGYALYFSRAPIPWYRDEFDKSAQKLPVDGELYRHIGLYAYRVGFLEAYVDWPPSVIEKAESLEQLRVLSKGHRIHVSLAAKPPGHGVDTEADLARSRQALT
ncbi:MAG: 3-deoxy-manno-octulosonate cytidylyltransferase [Gammaproteobacteria bacterium]|nr:3-deoxy-manno-octulosonate cytidylyltransferase [Gammaproteobacteria bacterium]